MDIIWMLKDLHACNFDLQMWVNNRFRDPNICMVRRDTTSHIITTEGLKFGLEGCDEMGDLMTEYQFDDITKDDVVLDLGANVGGFAIRAALKAKHVYAVEPLFYKELEANIKLNSDIPRSKITVMRVAIGNGEVIPLKYRDHSAMVHTYSLADIIKATGDTITFLKVDIEGAEWGINPYDFQGIRRIEFEAHGGSNSCMPVNPRVITYLQDMYDVTTTTKKIPYNSYWIHARPKSA